MKNITGKIKTASLLFRTIISVFLLGVCNEALSLTTQPISSPSTYQGSHLGEAPCNTTYHTTGYEPINPAAPNAKYPLFLYFTGTNFNDADLLSNYMSVAGQAVTAKMAAQGFVAVSVEYDNKFISLFDNSSYSSPTGLQNKLACMFDPAKPANLLNALCARSNVNCAAGIATWGHSQGALMAVTSGNYDRRINAAYTTGYSPFSGMPVPTLAFNRIRLVNAEQDTVNALPTNMYTVTGVNLTDCGSQTDQCLRVDGSGWILVRQTQLSQNQADHCWFGKLNCLATTENIEPNWYPGTSYVFSLAPSATWLAGAAVQTRSCPSATIALQAHANNNYVSAQLLTSGVPLKATSAIVSGWEKFSCMERGNGRIALQAQANGLYVSAISANGYQLMANSTEANATIFQYINVGGNNIELKTISNNSFVSADLTLLGQLIANRSIATTWETFTAIPQ